MTDTELFARAVAARAAAYTPYSHFAVGAALLCADGTVYTGGNIENAAYSPTVCAERVAFFKAISEGKREFAAIAIAGGAKGGPAAACSPCGVCRQVMAEFCRADFAVIVGRSAEDCRHYTLAELLPHQFSLV